MRHQHHFGKTYQNFYKAENSLSANFNRKDFRKFRCGEFNSRWNSSQKNIIRIPPRAYPLSEIREREAARTISITRLNSQDSSLTEGISDQSSQCARVLDQNPIGHVALFAWSFFQFGFPSTSHWHIIKYQQSDKFLFEVQSWSAGNLKFSWSHPTEKKINKWNWKMCLGKERAILIWAKTTKHDKVKLETQILSHKSHPSDLFENIWECL